MPPELFDLPTRGDYALKLTMLFSLIVLSVVDVFEKKLVRETGDSKKAQKNLFVD